jgi:protein dithiol:quinone oxidoreductase
VLHSRRALNLAGFLSCAAMLGYALYAEKVLHLEPCPLCMFQRVGIALLGVVFLMAVVLQPRGALGARIWAVLISLAAAVPIVVAGRHIWVQSQPEGSVPSCGATLDYMLDVFPVLEVVRKVLAGGGECAKIDWRFLGLTMPMCVMLGALVLVALAWWASSKSIVRAGYIKL